MRRNRIGLLLLVLSLCIGITQAQSTSGRHSKAKDSASNSSATSGAKVDLNSASQSDLEALPGVGAATAKKIIAGRPYSSPSDLSKAGVSQKTIDKISPMVTASGSSASSAASSSPVAEDSKSASKRSSKKDSNSDSSSASSKTANGPVDLNTASQSDLEALPGVGPATAKKIIAGRPYSNTSDLSKAGVSQKTIEKISPMVTASGSAPSRSTSQSSSTTSAMGSSSDSNRRSSKRSSSDQGSSAPSMSSPANSSSATDSTTRAVPSDSSSQSSASSTASPDTKVWVNKDSKIYHLPGDRWYGKTKNGEYMSLSDAERQGYRASKR